MVICYLARETPCNFYAMASWHLFNQGWFSKFIIRMMGAFSVNREGLDRHAIDESIGILQTAQRPLLLFPEGTTSRTNDQLMALMEGPAFIARTAAKRRAKQDGGKVVVHPVAIRYLYQGDIQQACNGVLSDIERKLTWRPEPDMPLIERIVRVGNALLSLKELQYGAQVSNQLSLRERQTHIVNHLLDPLEKEWLGSTQQGGVAKRIKGLRMKIFPDM
ncbi:MAG: 1-acyl-sn-glycerol-3-phosphate acyltransferase, partial [Planctomycetaceae bacterium]|nr:1-acyl-sn-glycerol-3-phosphate acyltransferase [Planctomycetaceae bacterium]